MPFNIPTEYQSIVSENENHILPVITSFDIRGGIPLYFYEL